MLFVFREFDKHAAAIIDMCFDENNELALRILRRKSALFSRNDPFQITQNSESRTFLATKTVLHFLDQHWYRRLNQHDQNTFWIGSLVSITFFSFVYLFFDKFYSNDFIMGYYTFAIDLYYVFYTYFNSY